MKKLKINPTDPDTGLLESAAKEIMRGGLVVFPTDTVYGIGVSLFNRTAVRRVFSLKGRPRSKGLIAMIAETDQVRRVAGPVDELTEALTARFWPGPLTLVLPAAPEIPDEATVGGTIGVRLPDSRLVRELIRLCGTPLATTSANLSDQPSAVTAAQAEAAIGPLADLIIDGGRCPLGIESTVVDAGRRPPAVLREGAISRRSIEQLLRTERPD
jgi:L-threonylcarbamoyladenylate synthase